MDGPKAGPCCMKLQGGARDGWTEVVLMYGHLLPRYPGVDLLRPAVVRPPPLLLPEESLDQRIWKMLAGYRAAVQKACGYRYVPEVSDRLVAQYRSRNMKQVSDLLIASKIRPVAWCLFSIRFWKMSHMSSKYPRPPVAWVYRRNRIIERDEWYGSVMPEMFIGSYLHITKTHRTLIKRYNRLKRELLRTSRDEGLTEQKVKDIVLDFLPPGMYRRLVKVAQGEISSEQERLDEALARGDYIW